MSETLRLLEWKKDEGRPPTLAMRLACGGINPVESSSVTLRSGVTDDLRMDDQGKLSP